MKTLNLSFFRNVSFINFFGEVSNNWPNYILGAIVYKTLESCDNHCWQYDSGLVLLQ